MNLKKLSAFILGSTLFTNFAFPSQNVNESFEITYTPAKDAHDIGKF